VAGNAVKEPPTAADVDAAGPAVGAYLPPTPLLRCAPLAELLDCDYYVKCENLQPVGAFKVRGGINLLSRLGPEERRGGLISASTGNHGQSLAYAGRLFGVGVLIYGPESGANQDKIEAMRRLGAEVRLYGRDFDEARREVERVAALEGQRYVHSANEPDLIAGVGTMGLEIWDQLPEVDVVIVPVGGGSGAAGLALALKERRPQIRLIGVQAARAPACHTAWSQRRLDVKAETTTLHEGLATRVPFAMTMELLWRYLDDFVLVEDEEIDAAIALLALRAKMVAEGAGAASLAAALKLKSTLQGKRVVGVLSGGNLPAERLAAALGPQS
jgi:threonine dehydratase